MMEPLSLKRRPFQSTPPLHAGCTTSGQVTVLVRGRAEVEFLVGVGRMDAACCRHYLRQRPSAPDYHLSLLMPEARDPLSIAVNGRTTVIPPGQYRILNPQDTSRVFSPKGFAGIEIGLSQAMLRTCRESVGLPKGAGPFQFDESPRPQTPAFKALVTLLTHYARLSPHPHHDAWLPLAMYGAGVQLLANLFWTHPSALRDRIAQWGYRHAMDSRLEPAMEVIRGHFAEPLTMTRWARLAGMSESSLFRLFTQEFKATPLEFLRRYRLEQAERLMAATPHPNMADIAFRVGYSSAYALRKSFRLSRGTSPTF